MIDYKSTSGSDSLIERVSSANLDGPISLTGLWEIIVRTKRLPDDLDRKVLFVILRDRLKNVEREVRQHALRVLADLVPVIDQNNLDKHMEFLLPDLIVNLSHVAPAVRKSTIDVLRIYLKHSLYPNEVLRKIMTIVPEDSHLMQGLLMAVPYFSNYQFNEETLVFLINQLFVSTNQEFLRETSVCSLVRTRNRLGADRFNHLIGSERLKEFQELCKEYNVHLTDRNEDNVILETEITLETGPAITMKIHQEKDSSSFTSNNFSDHEDFRHDRYDDSESELITRSPRKVRFGGEVVKMRTPESDSNQNSSDDNDIQTSVIIDRPTSIKITVSDNIAAIRTRHKSMIPVRITTGSNPSTPRKRIRAKRLYKSAPDLGRIPVSKIPLPYYGKSLPKLRESRKDKENENKEERVRKRSRGEDEFSPVPVHEEIEVLHNLTRSPERCREADTINEKEKNGDSYTSFQIYKSQEQDESFTIKKLEEDANASASKELEDSYVSFQVCKREETEETSNAKDTEDNSVNETGFKESEKNTYVSFQVYQEGKSNTPSPLEIVVRDLTHKDDTWTRTRALDDLITILRKNSINFDSVSIPHLLQTLFLYEKQPRLHYRAQEALFLSISAISLQVLNELYSQLCNDVIKVLPPPGIRLALLVMKRSSPKKFFEVLKVEPSERETTLQALIAAARTFPSSEIDLNRGIQLAFNAMKDNKRAVRQAALEALATLAQVAGNTMILEVVNQMSKDREDSDHLVNVIRTRLSRRQLPTVSLDGNIRYSSPREQEEFDWLCGGVPSLQKSSSLNSIKVSPSNYWKHNLRHEMDLPIIKSPSLYNDTSFEDAGKGSKEQVWAVDASTFPKIENGSIEKATLCPVYVLHRNTEQFNGRTYRNYDRGRSNSPPSRRRDVSQEVFSDINGNKAKRFFRQNEQFRKSFSSEHIYTGSTKSHEPTSFSLSSRSSTTSTGSSARSGNWLREFRSGIPVPINSETKLKIRSHRQSTETYAGPLIAQENVHRTKLESPQNTPIIRRSSPQHFTQPLPPPSSGSESSGYFTPPAEHNLKDPALDRFVSEDAFEENNNFELVPSEPNFQIVESEASESHEPEQRQSSASSADTSARLEDVSFEEPENQKEALEEPKVFSPLDEVDFTDNSRMLVEPRSKSRSEGNIKTSLPEITERKNVNSAPPLNDNVSLVPYSFSNSPEISPVKTSLPGSVASSDNTPTKKNSGQSPKRLMRRSISVRTPSIKKVKSSKAAETRPLSRPKEILNQSLAQMESYDWETIIRGLNTLISLSRNNPEVLEQQMHQVSVALAKNVRNLRSQVARTACHAASEIFSTCKKGLEPELEELAAPLLQRTADTNKFLRSDANAALDAMCLNLSVPRVVAVITAKGSTHQNCVVRAASTRLLGDIAMRIGTEKVFQLPKETRDKFLFVGANGLTEGSLETRQHAKMLMGTLAEHQLFHKTLIEAVPQSTMRHITKIIKSLK